MPKNLQTFNLKGDRKTTIQILMENEKKKTIPYPEKEDKIQSLKEKINDEFKQRKSEVDKVLDKYKTKGSLSKMERIPVVANKQSLAERIPFCEGKLSRKEMEKAGGASPPEDKKGANTHKLKKTFPDVRRLFKFFLSLFKFF